MDSEPRAGCSRRGRDGFTLPEVLVAFAILAGTGLAVQRGVVAAGTGLSRTESRIAAERVARSLLDRPFGAESLRLGARSGRSDGRDWTIVTEPIELPDQLSSPRRTGGDPVPPRWQPVRVTIRVGETPGTSFKIETVRLVPADD